MIYKVDFSIEAFRLLFESIYKRVESFALSEGESSLDVKVKFASLLLGDGRYNIIIDLTETGVSSHCLYVHNHPTIFVEQIKVDDPKNGSFAKDCLTYLENIPNIQQINMTANENKYKAFKKKYGFKVHKVLMVKSVESSSLDNLDIEA